MTPPLVRVALIGVGRMGQAIEALARSRQCEVVARFTRDDAPHGVTKTSIRGAVVTLEFSSPESSFENAMACLRAQCPVVVGTTGWGDRLEELQQAARTHQCAAVVSPNFSIGAQLFLAIAADASRRLRHQPMFDPHLLETHHAGKKDAPSGTALAAQAWAESNLLREVPITSIRTGSVPGTHDLMFDAPFEQIRLVHEVRDRRVFADGALVAARWLVDGRSPGVYSMQDVLSEVTA